MSNATRNMDKRDSEFIAINFYASRGGVDIRDLLRSVGITPHAVRPGSSGGEKEVWLEWRYPHAQNRGCWTLAHTVIHYICECRSRLIPKDYAMSVYHSEDAQSVFRFGAPFHLYSTAFHVAHPVDGLVPENVWKGADTRSPESVFAALCANLMQVASKLVDMVAGCSSHGRCKANFAPMLHDCYTRLDAMRTAVIDSPAGSPPIDVLEKMSHIMAEINAAIKTQWEYDKTGLFHLR